MTDVHPLGEDYYHGPAPSTALEEPGSRSNVKGAGTWGSTPGTSGEAGEAASETPLSKLKKDELVTIARELGLEVNEDEATVKELRASIEDEREFLALSGEARDLGLDPDGYTDTDELRDAVDDARAAAGGE
jgi:hypothetical protein